MEELFTEIITGVKELKEINSETKTKKEEKQNDIAKYFLKTARRKFSDEKINKKDIKKIIYIYNDLLNENRTIKKYINSKDNNEDLLKEVEQIIKLFIDDYCKNKKTESIWTKDFEAAGFIEPLLLGLIAICIGILFIGNLYLYM